MPTTEALNRTFDTDETVYFDQGQGGLTRLVVDAPFARAQLYLHGAHLAAWAPEGQEEVLFLSEASAFAADQPIRGGVPICFPWFGPRFGGMEGPAHGFARLREWTAREIRRGPDSVSIDLTLAPDSWTHGLWDEPFELQYTVTIGSALTMDLTTFNRGLGQMCLTEALHTYFRVSDVRRIGITGLSGITYVDKVAV